MSTVDDILTEMRDLRQGMLNGFRQIEALVNLYSIVPVRHAMPKPTYWTACQDFLLFLVAQVQEHRPHTILDIGSGATTVWMANALRHFGIPGRIIAIDHDEEFGAGTAATLARQGLTAFAEVRIAPLTEVEISDGHWFWYDPAQLKDIDTCDLVIIDGPPGNLNPLSRYPALPLLMPKLGDGARVFMDDAYRPDEQVIVERWCREFPEWTSRMIDHDKGTAVLSRTT